MTDIYTLNDNLQGKPKTIVLYRDGEIKEERFKDKIGVKLQVEQIAEDEKLKIVDAWRNWQAKKKEP